MENLENTPGKLKLDKASLKLLFIDQLNVVCCAKHSLIKNIPALVDLPSFIDLKFAFQESLESAERQVNRLNDIFGHIKENPTEERCQGMKAIIDEAFTAIKTTEEKSVTRDLAMIFYAKIIEHIEIISYRMLISIASTLGYVEITNLLKESLDECKENDKLFMLIALEYGLEDPSGTANRA
jgi:ferritin-like metal-binding protein YciE